MKKQNVLLIIFFSLALLQACKKSYDNPNHQVFGTNGASINDFWMGEPPNAATDDTSIIFPHYVKDYILFQPGTYWVYQDSATGVLDSQWVIAPAIDQIFSSGSPDQFGRSRYEYVETDIRSSYNKCIYVQNCYGGLSEYPKSTFFHHVYRNKYDTTLSTKEDIDSDPIYLIVMYKYRKYLYHNPISGGGVYDSIFDIALSNKYTTINLSFQNVVTVHDSKNYNESSAANYYWAKNIGMIKMQYMHYGKCWNLIRYHVVQ